MFSELSSAILGLMLFAVVVGATAAGLLTIQVPSTPLTDLRVDAPAARGGRSRGAVTPRASAASPDPDDAMSRSALDRDDARRPTNGGRMEEHERELGPIDITVIAYPAGAPMTGEAIPLLMDLVDRGIIRVLDVMFVSKDEQGMFIGFEATDLDDKGVGDLRVFEGASSGLLGSSDIETAADTLDPGMSAAVIVYENAWAAGFAAAVRRNGGVFIANQRVPLEDVVQALDAAEAAV